MKTDCSETEPYSQMRNSYYANTKSKVGHNPRIEDLFPGSFYMDKEKKEVYRPNQNSKKGIITTNTLLQ